MVKGLRFQGSAQEYPVLKEVNNQILRRCTIVYYDIYYDENNFDHFLLIEKLKKIYSENFTCIPQESTGWKITWKDTNPDTR